MIYIFLLIIAAAAATGILAGMAPWRRVARFETPRTRQEALPKISVISYVLRDEEDLSGYVDAIISQDYPDFELILVCDATAETSAMLSERFENTPNLHVTFIPPGSHNLSRRKLAQTIGIKRASGEVVVTTSTIVIPSSCQWLRSLAEPFADRDMYVACGYVRPSFADLKGPAKWYRQFDALLTSAQWMSEAIKGNPYRGDGFNLAFRRRLFFEKKGYASTLTLMDGDDDIFINEICPHGHGCLVLNDDSTVNTRYGEEASRIHADLKDRYTFTRRYLPKAPFFRASLLSWMQWILAAGFIFLIYLAAMPFLSPIPAGAPSSAPSLLVDPTFLPAIFAAAAALLILAGFWIIEIISYRRLATRLGAVRLFWAVTPFMLARPICNFIFFLNHYPLRKSHFTWVRN